MAKNFIQVAWEKFSGRANNAFNSAFYSWYGGGYAKYDEKNKTYLEKGYNSNPDVFACINKATVKTVSVPYYIKKVKDKKAYSKLQPLALSTKSIHKAQLQTKAYEDEEMNFPLADPNPTQTWSDVIGLYKTFMKITGNYYQYNLSPKEGMNKGVPMQSYVLPSHLVQIVLKKDAGVLEFDNPIDHYMLIEGNQWIKFEVEDIIHVKYVNPNFDLAGSHLYGQSPLRSASRNINSQNSAIDNNIKTLQSGGAFGFIHAKDDKTPLTPEQADSLKQRLIQMDASPDRLSKIAGSSAAVGFTRISLTTDELKPFDYMGWDRKTICNVLNYPDELLNNDGKASLGSTDTTQARKQLITDDIQPDLVLLQQAWNKSFIPKFKGYENAVIEWDVTELPEMQEDVKDMVAWMKDAPLTPNEKRRVLKYETLNDDGMDIVWLPTNIQRIDDVSPGVMDNANQT